MSRKDRGKSVFIAEFEGKRVQIGDQLPLPTRKLSVRPSKRADDPARGPKGVFTNGRS